jgi:hypothetical protein
VVANVCLRLSAYFLKRLRERRRRLRGGTPKTNLFLAFLIHALGWADAPRCGTPPSPVTPPITPVHAPRALWRVPVSGLASPEFGVLLNPTNYLRRQTGFGAINSLGW